MAADVLGRRVHDDLRAERERLLKIRRCKGVVDGDQSGSGRRSAAIAAMSTSLSSGLVGVSTQKSFVLGWTAARTA